MFSGWEERAQRRRDRTAHLTYERLLQDQASYRSAPSTRAAVLVAAGVIVAALVALAALVWASMNAHGVVQWFLVGLGWACVIVARPRAHRLPGDVIVLDAASYPGLHQLVREMAPAVGVRAPAVLGVNLDFNAYVVQLGWRGRNAMVLGLPLMTLGTWPERLGTIGHELGHLRGRDTFRGHLVASAGRILGGVLYLIAPNSSRHVWAQGISWAGSGASGALSGLTNVFQAIAALPFVAVITLLERVQLSSGQHREYLADRRSAEVVGSDAMAHGFLYHFDGLETAARSAARRGEDPFEVLLLQPPLTRAGADVRLRELENESARADATHPLDHLRIKLIQASGLPPSPAMPGESTWARAEEELARLREERRKRFGKELIYSGTT